MMTESSEPKGTVAIIGSGPAGLFATHALSKKGYLVTIFEKSDHLTLAGHSYKHGDKGESDVVDIPMRTFSGRYYANLFQMLEHLNIPTQIHRFRYIFADGPTHYFQFFSNFHRLSPCLENDALTNFYIFLCYLWYTIAIFLFPPHIRGLEDSYHTETESLDQYARRICLPDYFLHWYLLPLFSSVATCSHDDLRNFPAAYLTDYRKGTLAAHHHTVKNMRELQNKLAEGATQKVKHSVLSVTSEGRRVTVRYSHSSGTESRKTDVTDVFDHAILATSASEANRLHEASGDVTSRLVTCPVRITVHHSSKEQEDLRKWTRPSEILLLSTRGGPKTGVITDSTHLHRSGVAVKVTANPNKVTPEDADRSLHKVDINRPLPSPQSHDLLLAVFNRNFETDLEIWRNGDGNVYLAGGYASAGLPLLEACVRSGLEAAERIGGELPFDIIRNTPF